MDWILIAVEQGTWIVTAVAIYAYAIITVKSKNVLGVILAPNLAIMMKNVTWHHLIPKRIATIMIQKIEPCPCGSARHAVEVHVYGLPPATEPMHVLCPNCDRSGPLRNSEADAIAGWNNQRKNDPSRPAGPSAGHAFADASREWSKPSGTEQEGDES